MPRTERDPLGPGLVWRLRSELDRVQPRWSQPRYLNPTRVGVWRIAPAVMAVAVGGILFLTAFAATGTANPAVWTERVVTVIHPAPPSATPEITPSPAQPQAAPPIQPKPEPSDRPEPTSSPQPIESPEPGGDHSGSSSSLGSPTPGDH